MISNFRSVPILFLILFSLSSCGKLVPGVDTENSRSNLKSHDNSYGAIWNYPSLEYAPPCSRDSGGNILFLMESQEYVLCIEEVSQWVNFDLGRFVAECGIQEVAPYEILKIKINKLGGLDLTSSHDVSGSVPNARDFIEDHYVFRAMLDDGVYLAESWGDLEYCALKNQGNKFFVFQNGSFALCNGEDFEVIEQPSVLNSELDKSSVLLCKWDVLHSSSVECEQADFLFSISVLEDYNNQNIERVSETHYGFGEPHDGLGEDGDFYKDNQLSLVYEKINGKWVLWDDKWEVLATATIGGSVTPAGKNQVQNNGSLTVEYIADEGYCFDQWKLRSLDQSSGWVHHGLEKMTTVYVNGNKEIRAFFTDKCDFTVDVKTAPGIKSTFSGKNLLSKGKDLTIEWSVEEGYAIEKIEVNGKEISKLSREYLITDLIKDYTIEFFTYETMKKELLSDFSKGNFDGKASSVGGSATGHWFIYTDEREGGSSSLNIVDKNGSYSPLKMNENIGNAQKDGTLSVQTQVFDWIDQQAEWGTAYTGLIYAFDVDSSLTGGWKLKNAQKAMLEMDDMITLEYKYPEGESLIIELYNPSHIGGGYRPAIWLTGSGTWQTKSVSISDFVIPDWDTDPSHATSVVLPKTTALIINRKEYAREKYSPISASQIGKKHLEIRRLCVGPCPN